MFDVTNNQQDDGLDILLPSIWKWIIIYDSNSNPLKKIGSSFKGLPEKNVSKTTG